MLSLIPPPLITLLRSRVHLDWNGIHGAPHWSRVRRNGLLLAERSPPGTSTKVIELFAFLHDSCRHNDGYDPMHDQRAADSIAEGGAARPRPSSRCRSAGTRTGWTWEGWGTPPPERLCTKAAKDAKRIEWAYRRSLQRPAM